MPRLSLLTYSLGAAMLCYGLALFVFGPCLTAMAATFEVPLGRLGLIFTAFSVGLLPSVLSVGYLSELVGKRLVLLVSVLLMATSCALFAAVSSIWAPPSFPLAMGAVVLLGIGAGGIEVLANAVVADDNQPSPGFALNVTHAFFAIGAVLGPLGAGAVLRAELPWQSVFYGAAGLFVVLFILLFPQREPAAQEAAFTLGAALRLLSSPLLLLLLAVLAMYVGAEAGLTVWVSPLMEEVLGSPRASAGMAVSIFWAFMVVGRLGVSFLAPRQAGCSCRGSSGWW
jgi:fucose permease